MSKFLSGALLFIVLLAGCSASRPTRYFLLSTPQTNVVRTNVDAVELELGPITIPRYLDRNGITQRNSHHELDVSDLNQWAEPFKDTIARTLRLNLEACSHYKQVELFPWKNKSLTTQRLQLDFSALEKQSSPDVLVEARYVLEKSNSIAETSVLSVKTDCNVDRNDFEGITACLSEALADFARQLCDKA